jgi:hypothetical protein
LPDFEKFHVYCDESATSERFTVIGAIICHHSVASKFAKWLDDIVDKSGAPTTELKWGKVKKHNLPRYKAITSAMTKCFHKQYAKYSAIIVDNSQMNHLLYNEGDKEIGFSKMLFQLLFKFARTYRNRPRFYVYLDYRTTKHTPDRLRDMLNRKAARVLRVTHNPFRVCQFRQSHHERLIQATDIITGAIAFKMNQHDSEAGAAQQKIDLMKHIASEIGLVTLSRQTTYADSQKLGVDLWHIDLSDRAAGLPRS